MRCMCHRARRPTIVAISVTCVFGGDAYLYVMRNGHMQFLASTEWEYLLRIVLAAVCGGFVGCEREKRFKSAGVRTHMLVAMSSALMMIVSKYGFFDVIGYDGISLDASRIAAGVVTAIGFLGAGVIFVRKENTIGVTTAAGLWGTVGLGIALGAGMYVTGIFFTLLMIMFQILLHNKHLRLGTQLIGTVTIPLNDSGSSVESIGASLKQGGLSVRNLQVNRGADGQLILTANIIFRKRIPISQAIARLEKIGTVVSVESFTIN